MGSSPWITKSEPGENSTGVEPLAYIVNVDNLDLTRASHVFNRCGNPPTPAHVDEYLEGVVGC